MFLISFVRHFLNWLGFGPCCIACGAPHKGESVVLSLYEGRGGIFKAVWMCAPCNERPWWAKEESEQ